MSTSPARDDCSSRRCSDAPPLAFSAAGGLFLGAFMAPWTGGEPAADEEEARASSSSDGIRGSAPRARVPSASRAGVMKASSSTPSLEDEVSSSALDPDIVNDQFDDIHYTLDK